MTLRILMYEDSEDWKRSFERLLKRRLASKNISFHMDHKLNTNTLDQDIQFPKDIILVDCDLGENSGEDVLRAIDGDPDYRNTKVFFYSGGVSVDDLRFMAAAYKLGYVRCSTKDDLEDAIALLFGC